MSVDKRLITATQRDVDGALALLNDAKATNRKLGVKNLSGLLDSVDCLRALDELTLRLRPENAVTACTWPGMVSKMARHVQQEVEKKKAVDAMLSKTLRKMADLAHDERRTGRKALLVRRAARLFNHVRSVLEVTGVNNTSPLGQDYSHLLRKVLLPVPEYCAAATPDDFMALIESYINWLEGDNVLRAGEAVHRASESLATLSALLTRFPGDMPPDFQACLVEFFQRLAPRVASARLGQDVLQAVTSFLMQHGRDVPSECAQLHDGYGPVALQGLKARDPLTRDGAALYVRAQLALGGVGPEALASLQRWAHRELGTNPKWGGTGRAQRARLTRGQDAQLSLMADIFLHSSGVLEAGGELSNGGDEDHRTDGAQPPPAKRARPAPALLSTLGQNAAAQPAVWAPLAARLLLQRGLSLPAEVHAEWLQRLTEALPVELAARAPSEGQHPDHVLWLLRFAHALALAAPPPATAGAGASQRWQATWQTVLSHAQIQPAACMELDACLWVLSCIAARGLGPLPPGFHQLWGVALLDKSPTPAGVHFAATALRAGADSVAHSGRWEGGVLQWLAQGEAAGNPRCPTAAAFEAFLRLEAVGGEAPSMRSTDSDPLPDGDGPEVGFAVVRDDQGELPWGWWEGDATAERQLAALCRGVTYMQGKAKAVAAAAAQRRQQAASAADTSGGLSPAGLQMHLQACTALENALYAAMDPAAATPPPTAHQAATHLSLLTQLLMTCATAAAVASRACAAAAAAEQAMPSSWQPDATLMTSVRLALLKASPLLCATCCTLEGLLPMEQEALHAAVRSLAAYEEVVRSAAVSEGLDGCLTEVDDLFANAETLTSGALATQAAGAAGATAAAPTLIDEELDMGGTARLNARSGAAGPFVSSSASLAAACKQRCVALLQALAPALPVGAGATARSLLEESRAEGQHPPSAALPAAVHLSLVQVLVCATCAAVKRGCHEGADMVAAAVTELGADSGVLSWDVRAKNVRGGMLFALQQATALAGALAQHGSRLATAGEALGHVAHVVAQCLELADELGGSACPTRIALARAVATLFAADPSLFPEGQPLFDHAIAAVASLVVDECYAARLAGGKLVQRLFAQFTDPSVGFNELRAQLRLRTNAQVLQQDGEGEEREAHVETAIFMLAETAAASAPLELDCILLLCQEAAGEPSRLPLVAATIDWIALTLRYPDRHAYAAWHHPAFVHCWFVSGSNLDALLAVKALAAPSPDAARSAAAFAGEAAPALVATLCLLGDVAALDQLAQLQHGTRHRLLHKHLDAVLALGYPGISAADPNTQSACRQLFDFSQGSVLVDTYSAAGSNLMASMASNYVEAVGRMLAAARERPHAGADPSLPYYTPDVVVKAVVDLIGPAQDSPEQRAALLWGSVLGGNQIASLLLAVQRHVAAACHPRHQRAAVGALLAAVRLLGPRVRAPATFRYAVSILLRLLRVQELRSVCCVLLRDVASYAMADAQGMAALGAMLPDVLSTLVEAVSTSKQDSEELSLLVRLVESLTVKAPPELQRYLRQVDPVPANLTALVHAARAVEAQRAGVTAAEQLSQFAARAASMTPTLRRRALKALRQTLAQQQATLFEPATSDDFNIYTCTTISTTGYSAAAATSGSEPTAAGAAGLLMGDHNELRCRPEVRSAAWRLAVLSNDLADARLAEFAGELLALMGPLDPGCIAFDASAALNVQPTAPEDASSSAAPADRGAGGRSSRSLSQGGSKGGKASKQASAGLAQSEPGGSAADAVAATWVAALRLLCDYLIDEDAAVVKAAQSTLRHLLGTVEGRAALQRLDAATHPLVAIFSPQQAAPAQQGSAHTGTGGVEAAAVWRLDGQAYGVWACTLAHVFLHRAASPVLFHCSPMARLKPAFAELLLPLAFSDLAHSHPPAPTAAPSAAAAQPDASQRLAAVMAAELLPVGHRHPKAMRLLLRCLNHLRGMQLDWKMGPVKGGKAASKSKGAAGIADWRKVYWVDLDYLAVAAAAVRSRAFFTALLYVEAWCDDRSNGRLALPDPATDPRHGEVYSLLLEMHSRIEEPDGLYAVARSHELLPQLRRHEREGDWAQALVTADLALQLLADEPQQASSQGQLDGSTVGPAIGGLGLEAARASLMRSLSQLGASTVLAAVATQGTAHGRAAGSTSGGTSASLAAAVEMGRWVPLDPGSSESAPTDASLSAAVGALASGSAERCSQALAAARRVLVAGLATAGQESAADVNPALIRLQMLQEVSEAWELKWPALPDLGSVGSPTKARRQLIHVPPAAEFVAATAGSTAAAAGGTGGGGGTSNGSGALVFGPEAFDHVMRLWRGREGQAGAGGRYNLLAPLQDLRGQLLRTLDKPAEEAACLESTAAAARKTGHYGQAAASLFRLQRNVQRAAAASGGLQGAPGAAPPAWVQALAGPSAPWRVEEAKLLWASGQQDSALGLVRQLLRGCQQQHAAAAASAPVLHSAYLQTLTAKWMAHMRTESDTQILHVMKQAADVVSGFGPVPCRILYRLAQYADGLYRAFQDRKNTVEWATAQAVITSKQATHAALHAELTSRRAAGLSRGRSDAETNLVVRNMTTLEKVIRFDVEERAAQERREVELRSLALSAYGNCLITGNKYDLPSVFRLLQLWLALAADRDVNTRVAAALRAAPSHKFLPLIYQVASRLSAAPDSHLEASGFQPTLAELLVRLGKEHPFHSLPQVFALRNNDRDQAGHVVTAEVARGGMAYAADEDKVAAAGQVLEWVAVAGEGPREVVTQMQQAIESYIQLAAIPVGKELKEMAFPGHIRRALLNLTRVPVLSVSLPVDPSCRYDHLPHIASLSERICFVGGVNKPKRVDLVDSDGVPRRQLVKSGNDDMRQDAVMQQFFWLLNTFLDDSAAAAARALRIKTYKVVPFSPAAGLLEWVDDTRPLGDYLVGGGDALGSPSGAHARYRRPGDLSLGEAFQELHKAHRHHPGDVKQLRPVFDTVCSRFPPVLHHFFVEQFRSPGAWFEGRLAFTRSVAVNSMAGHVIGLGDRHSSNILLDTRSAEVVHIDLGIAFEQGRFLVTPELVPFRLTRDIVDGMGVTGVEGVMRRCCEETMRVVRSNKDSILTVLEVFIHDPLYKWALTPVQAARRQRGEAVHGAADGTSGTSAGGGGGGRATTPGLAADGEAPGLEMVLSGNADAERTLLRIKQKLEGIEGGESGGRGVQGQVQYLLSEAMDPNNLCRMYLGWLAII